MAQPAQAEAVRAAVRPPHSYGDVLAVRRALQGYAEVHRGELLAAIMSVYLVMQLFGVPGTMYLSLLTGGLYPFATAFPLLLAASTFGASSCYCLSTVVGRKIAYSVWPSRLKDFEAEVGKRREHMLLYMLFLRLTPFFPNTFINWTAPIIGMPFPAFFVGTLLGTLPNNVLSTKAGEKLAQLGDVKLAELFDTHTIAMLCLCIPVMAVPTLMGYGKPKPADEGAKKAD